MKIKHKLMLCMAGLVLFLGACGGENKGVSTAKYYYPKQESETEQQNTEETAKSDTSAGAQQISDLGSDQFMILENDMTGEQLILKQLASGKEYVYHYTLATRFLDKYGNRATVSYFEPGRVICVREKDDQGKAVEVQISDEVWEYPDVTRYTIDESRGIFKVGEERYSYDEDLFIQADGDVWTLSDLTENDTIRLVGVGKKLISVAVTTGHGELVLKNTDLFDGSFIQIGEKIFAEITPDMTLEIPEGTYTVTVANNGYGGSKDITIKSGEKVKLDLDTLKGEGPKMGNILFAIDVEGAILQIDGEVKDYTNPIPLQYGVHTLTVMAPEYDTVSKKLFVNSEEATIAIGLSSEGTDTSDTTASETSSESTETNSTTTDTTQPGSLAGSLAGSYAGGSTAGSTSTGTSTSGTTTDGSTSGTTSGTVTDGSTSGTASGTTSTGTSGGTSGGTSSDSSTDYLSTLSELLSMLSGDSSN